MKIFQALTNGESIKNFYDKTGIELNYLIAYNHLYGEGYKITVTYRDMIEDLYLDSGAYAAYMNKTAIKVSEYCHYIKKFGDRFDEFFSLDDDFKDPRHNLLHQFFLEGCSGKRPVPVVHDASDPLGEVKRYYDLGHRFIAIGSDRKLKDEVFESIKTECPDLRIHMFGTLNRKMLIKHRPYSADASSWALQAGLGGIFYWHPEEKKEYRVDVSNRKKKASQLPHISDFEHKESLEQFLHERFSYSLSELEKSVKARQIVNAYFFHQLEEYINSLPE